MEAGKNATAIDQKYLQYAQDQLYGELAIVLEMDKNQVEQFITESIHKQELVQEV